MIWIRTGDRIEENNAFLMNRQFAILDDMDQDGPALVGSPDAGFSGLRLFGPGLINHMQLKVRNGLELDGIMLIDSPGMIDSPSNQGKSLDYETTSRDRGYDFMGVTKWFAERADVILLFFDPYYCQ